MLVFILVLFALFILGFFVFIAANAGRGRDDWNSMNSWSDTSSTTVDDNSGTGCESSEGCESSSGDCGGDGGGGD
ncbi:MAG: hypothetical protein JNK63_04620 [Chthonomonas sp.]|nr:hypothetical protein [Chthonomonas sp.]